MSARFEIIVDGDPEEGEVTVTVRPEKDEVKYWVAITEWILHITASKSGAGYNAAMDLLVDGARTWEGNAH